MAGGSLGRELDQPDVLGVKVYYALIGQDPMTRDKYLEASIFDFLPHHQLEVLNERGAWVTLHVPRAGRLGILTTSPRSAGSGGNIPGSFWCSPTWAAATRSPTPRPR